LLAAIDDQAEVSLVNFGLRQLDVLDLAAIHDQVFVEKFSVLRCNFKAGKEKLPTALLFGSNERFKQYFQA